MLIASWHSKDKPNLTGNYIYQKSTFGILVYYQDTILLHYACGNCKDVFCMGDVTLYPAGLKLSYAGQAKNEWSKILFSLGKQFIG